MNSNCDSIPRENPSAHLALTLQSRSEGGPTTRSSDSKGAFDHLNESLNPDYRILGLLSHGAMSTVYEAIDMRLNRRVALKVLSPGRAGSTTAVKAFQREACIAARLGQHPHFAAVYKIDYRGGFFFFSSQFVPGESLRQRIDRRGILSIRQVRLITRQLLEAMQSLHSEGYLHCDIKPNNILFDKDNNLTLIDFGIARSLRQEPEQDLDTTAGTPGYMSPEQISGGRPAPASDLYSLGVVIYEMLTGQRPFGADELPALLMQQCTHSPKALDVRAPWIPPSLRILIEGLLQMDPALRPASAAKALELLESNDSSLSCATLTIKSQATTLQATTACPANSQDTDTDIARLNYPAPAKTAEFLSDPKTIARSRSRQHGRSGLLRWAATLLLAIIAGAGLFTLQGYIVASSPDSTAVNISVQPIQPQESVLRDVPPASPVLVDSSSETKIPEDNNSPISPLKKGLEYSPTLEKIRTEGADVLPLQAADSSARPATRRRSSDDRDRAMIEAGGDPSKANSATARFATGSTDSVAPSFKGPAVRAAATANNYPVEHDHVKGFCRGLLILHSNSLEFASEKEKDSRRWDYRQLRKIGRKGTDQLSFSTSEKDLKKLGIISRNYRFRFEDPAALSIVFETLRVRASSD